MLAQPASRRIASMSSKPSISGIMRSSRIDAGHALAQAREGGAAIGGFAHAIALGLQLPAEQFSDHRVVVDDQHRQVAPVLPDGGEQPLPIERLREVLRRSEGIAEAPVVHHRQHDHGDLRQRRIGLERGEHGPAVETGHQDVERDHIRAQLPGQAQAVLAAGSGDDTEPLADEEALHEVADRRVVVDHEHRLGCRHRLGWERRGRLGHRLGHDRRNAHREGAASPGLRSPR